jgi:hypothetical protein
MVMADLSTFEQYYKLADMLIMQASKEQWRYQGALMLGILSTNEGY